ncbi:MAG TPA: depupylase/deamidase Dop [Dermatophilaceae bacterium]|nr:depupylase/deamidase Dop [Dermatophilaceae bacterium]
MGIETEYGVSVPGQPHANPMILSGEVILAYARAHGDRVRRVRWDYSGESPLSDARGFELSRSRAHYSQLTDEAAGDPTIANLVLTNGARLYVDHAHPEYSSPEVTSARQALVWDRAGELVMAESVAVLAAEANGTGSPINVYKNNTDGKGASYGTHENYLLSRDTPFARVAAQLMPFFVVRQIICGAGRVGLGQTSQAIGFQISSRSDFFEAEIGLETTFRRPIINTRDEPHADPSRYRRLHVIVGDANLCDVAGLLKLGTTSLVLAMIEADELGDDLALAEPVPAMTQVSHDSMLTTRLRLADGRRMTGLEMLRVYQERAEAFAGRHRADLPEEVAEETREVLGRWDEVLTGLEIDPSRCAGQLDWVAKLAVLQGYRDRDGLDWDDPRLAAVDIQWSDVRPERGLARRLEAAGRIERLVDAEEVSAAVAAPPETTRAWFRGECVRRYRPQVASASWDSVVFDIPELLTLQRVATHEPLRGTRALTEDLLDASPDARSLLRRLAGVSGNPDTGAAGSASP